MTPTHVKKPVSVRAFIFHGHNPFDEEHDKAKLIPCDSTFDDCTNCTHPIQEHAYIKTTSGEALVCPGDYVINNPRFPEDYYPCKPDIFNATYDDMKDDEEVSYSNESNDISQSDIQIISLKLRAAELLLDYSSDDIDRLCALDFMRNLIEAIHSEPEVVKSNGLSFGDVMALINDNEEILFSRKAYHVNYIFYNSETCQFMSYAHGRVKLHTFDSKDYTANDWYIVN